MITAWNQQTKNPKENNSIFFYYFNPSISITLLPISQPWFEETILIGLVDVHWTAQNDFNVFWMCQKYNQSWSDPNSRQICVHFAQFQSQFQNFFINEKNTEQLHFSSSNNFCSLFYRYVFYSKHNEHCRWSEALVVQEFYCQFLRYVDFVGTHVAMPKWLTQKSSAISMGMSSHQQSEQFRLQDVPHPNPFGCWLSNHKLTLKTPLSGSGSRITNKNNEIIHDIAPINSPIRFVKRFAQNWRDCAVNCPFIRFVQWTE